MELTLYRKPSGKESTIGDLHVNGAFECYICEDVDRGLRSDMPAEQIAGLKIHGKTAIPAGRYRIVISFSNRFKKYLPELLDVPGYAGVRIHPGNKAEDTEGCLLPGMQHTDNQVVRSRDAFKALFDKLKAAEKKEKIYITIKSEKAL